jgi:hypothetical protein
MSKLNGLTESSTSPIKDFIASALMQIKNALPDDARVDGIIKIDLTTIIQKEKGGGIDVRVLNVGTDVTESQTQKISIPIRILTDTGLAVEAALKAKAEADILISESDKVSAEKKIKNLQEPRVFIARGR